MTAVHHELLVLETPQGLVRHTPWGWRVGCVCGVEQDKRLPRGTKKAGLRWYYEHKARASS